MSITTIQATQIGSHALHYLSEGTRDGSVVSVFRHGASVLFKGGEASAFIVLQTHEIPLHPWAIETCELASPQVGGNVRMEPKRSQLQIGDEIIDLSHATVHALTMKPWTEHEISHVQGRIPLIKELLAKEFAQRPRDLFYREIDETLKRWRQSGCADALLGLIGLGTGSTPSGDDLIVGMLAAFATLGRTTLAQLLQTPELRQRTHPASAQMIEAAMNGAFSHVLLDLAHHLGQAASTGKHIQQCVKIVAEQGATSGAAILRGFSAALSTEFEI